MSRSVPVPPLLDMQALHWHESAGTSNCQTPFNDGETALTVPGRSTPMQPTLH